MVVVRGSAVALSNNAAQFKMLEPTINSDDVSTCADLFWYYEFQSPPNLLGVCKFLDRNDSAHLLIFS